MIQIEQTDVRITLGGADQQRTRATAYEPKPFCEGPDRNQQKRMEAHDLFSLFTANVIKEKIRHLR